MEQEISKEGLKYQVLRLLAIRINSSVPIKEIIQEGIARAIEIMDLEAGSISLWDEETKELVSEAVAGPKEKTDLLSTIEKGAIQVIEEISKSNQYILPLKKKVYAAFSPTPSELMEDF